MTKTFFQTRKYTDKRGALPLFFNDLQPWKSALDQEIKQKLTKIHIDIPSDWVIITSSEPY